MKNIFCVFSCLVCLSCGVVDFSPSDSIKVNPSEYNQIIKEDEDIYVKFSFSPDHASAQSAFEVQDAGGRVAGSFKWKESTMIFKPKESFKPAQRYFLKYAGEVSDISGKEYVYNIFTPFFYKINKSVKPVISRSNPPDGSILNAKDKISFFFTAPMEPSSFLKNFSISPDIDCAEEWNEEHTQFILTPKEGWDEHQVYRFSFNGEITSCEGVSLADPKIFSFYSSSGAVIPVVLSIDTALNDGLSYPILLSGLDGVKEKDVIRISFSVPMDASDTEGAFSINPDIIGHTCWISDSVLVFVPDEEWKGETLYSVSISASAKSKKGILLPDIFEASFVPDVIPLKLLRIEGKDADGFPLTTFNPSQEVDIDVGDALLPENIYTFSFVFNHAFADDEEKEQVFSGIRLRSIFPPNLIAPKVMSLFWSGDSKLQITYTGFEPEGHIYSLDVNGLEKITLRTR